jgi:hypothetical protein
MAGSFKPEKLPAIRPQEKDHRKGDWSSAEKRGYPGQTMKGQPGGSQKKGVPPADHERKTTRIGRRTEKYQLVKKTMGGEGVRLMVCRVPE